MATTRISFRETGFFSGLICDYLEEKAALHSFYNHFPKPEEFTKQIKAKQQSFSPENREQLVTALRHQYQGLQVSEKTHHHIEKIAQETTFTVTTGHQLNVFTGPLYFFYKIITTLQLAERLQEEHPGYHFVPVYWMATEDHDVEEINHFYYKGKKLHWNTGSNEVTGCLKTDGLEETLHTFERELGSGKWASYLKELFAKAYIQHSSLAEATRYLVNELFGRYGLVILDANVPELKRLFIPYCKEELRNQTSFKEIAATVERLQGVYAGYTAQVNPRLCNLFYLHASLRKRLVAEKDGYRVHDTDIWFSEAAILKELDGYPERFSPNVVMRPLYQEVILPNLSYIGGAGELAYWLQLKSYFEASGVLFPILTLRHSALLLTQKQAAKLEKLGISPQLLFLSQVDLITHTIKEISDIPIDFSPQKTYLQQQFKELYKLAEKTDVSFLGAVRAEEARQLKGLHRLEKRLLKAQKRKEAGYVNRVATLHQELFPNGKLQERIVNFSEVYEAYGAGFIDRLFEEMNAFEKDFLIIPL